MKIDDHEVKPLHIRRWAIHTCLGLILLGLSLIPFFYLPFWPALGLCVLLNIVSSIILTVLAYFMFRSLFGAPAAPGEE